MALRCRAHCNSCGGRPAAGRRAPLPTACRPDQHDLAPRSTAVRRRGGRGQPWGRGLQARARGRAAETCAQPAGCWAGRRHKESSEPGGNASGRGAAPIRGQLVASEALLRVAAVAEWRLRAPFEGQALRSGAGSLWGGCVPLRAPGSQQCAGRCWEPSPGMASRQGVGGGQPGGWRSDLVMGAA